MKSSTKTILTFLKVITWIAFIGLCIQTGALLFNFLRSLIIQSQISQNLFMGLDLSALLEFSRWQYIGLTALIVIESGSIAWFFYLVTRLFSEFNSQNPFGDAMPALLIRLSSAALQVSVVALVAREWIRILSKKGLYLSVNLEGGVEFLYMAGVIFIIAQVFKHGLEIQSENQLTI